MQPPKTYAVLFLAGPLFDTPAVRYVLANADTIIAADGGLDHADRFEVTVDRIFGDLDSVSRQSIERARAQGIEVHTYPVHKDETDGALAMEALLEGGGVTDYVVMGAIGALRTDHMLGNLMTAIYWMNAGRVQGRVWLTNGHEWWHPMHGPACCDLRTTPLGPSTVEDRIVSLIALTDIGGFTASGLVYEAEDLDLPMGLSRAVSNRVTHAGGPASISITSGIGVLCITRDDVASTPDTPPTTDSD